MGKYREGVLNNRLIEVNKLCDDLREVIAQLQKENKNLEEQLAELQDNYDELYEDYVYLLNKEWS